jgi:hypothetical protein
LFGSRGQKWLTASVMAVGRQSERNVLAGLSGMTYDKLARKPVGTSPR